MTTTPGTARPAERVTLPREFANFLIELAIALQNHAVYPPGHPFLARSAETVVRRLDALLLDRGSVSFGVARDRLVIEGVATEPENPVLSGLAGRLHRHRVGAVSITRGVTAQEIATLLGALAVEAELAGPLLAAGEGPQLAGVRLHPLSFGNLEMAADQPGEAGGEVSDRSARAPQLWIGLARAALASGEAAEDGPTPEPAAVASAINEHAHAVAYDQVIVGYLLQLAEELRSGGGRGSAEVRRRLSRMIVELRPETLRRLVEMGGDGGQRGRFLLDASQGFAADAVVRLVEAAASAHQHDISESMLRLLSKLAVHAEQAPAALAGATAGTALREQVERLVGGWTLADPNPEAYRRSLEGLAQLSGARPVLRGPHAPEPLRIVQTALEVDAPGAAVWAALDELRAAGRLPEVLELLETTPEGSRVAGEAWRRLSDGGALRELLRAGPEAARALDLLAAHMGPHAAAPLMDELAESESRAVRRAALARLVGLGRRAAAEAQRRLDDERWYVVRNCLFLLAELRAVPRSGAMERFLRHPDERVRREAYKLVFRNPEDRTHALSLALADGDGQALRLALAECASECPAPVVPLVCRRVTDAAVEPELRAVAVRSLGATREPLALRTLLRITDGGQSMLRRRRLPPRSPEVVAAVEALANGWWDDVEAVKVVALARRSADPELRAAAGLREGS